MALLLAFGFVLYGILRHNLLHHHDTPLRTEAGRILKILAEHEDCRDLTPFQAEKLGQGGGVVLIHEVDGRREVFFVSPEIAADPILPKLTALLPKNPSTPQFETVEGKDLPWRVLSLPYRSKAGTNGVIHVTEDLGDLEETLADLRLALLIFAPVGVLISGLGGYWLAEKALAPVERVTTMAREIEASNLNRRLPHPGVDCEIGRLVETLNHMFSRLDASFVSMRRFTADASHELRSPLATLRNTIDIMLERPRTVGEYQATLHSVEEEVERLSSIVEDLLLLARADAGRMVMKLESVRLDQITKAQVEAHLPLAEAAGIDLRVSASTPVQAAGDERWLHQLMGNLLDNALKFTPPNGMVTVAVVEDEEGIRLTVEDSGPGIPEEDLPRIFERFFRSDPSRARNHTPGSGLGLAITAWIAEAHGASIRASNRPGGGAAFTVLFPPYEIRHQ
jgi:two-component system OmpR family sensor kinase